MNTVCPVCGERFFGPSEADKKGEIVYCSKKCADKDNKK